MAAYDRSAQRQQKKAKKSGGVSSLTRKRKHYSDMIPYRKLANMLQSCGAEFAGKRANDLKHGRSAFKGDLPDNGATVDRLVALAADGVGGEYGSRVQELARQALEFVK